VKGKRVDVLMPQLGETVAEGKITKWFKSAGDAVKPGDNLFEIETDKVTMEVPAIAAGTLTEIRVQTGAVAPVGAVVAVLSGEGGAANVAPTTSAASGAPPALAASKPPPQKPSSPFAPAKTGAQGQGLGSRFRGDERGVTAEAFAYRDMDAFFEVRTPEKNYGPAKQPGGHTATPLARRLAGERGIDLSQVKGSGPHGRIVAADVETASVSGADRGAPLAAGVSADQVKALYQGVDFEEVPLDGMRKTIAARLTESKQTVPHFYLTMDVELDAAMRLREEANAGAPKKDGGAAYKLSINDFVIKALALALQRVPTANAVWAGDRILRFRSSDVGVAVALEGGLLTPVIRSAEAKSLSAISGEMKDLAARAKDKKLKPAEYQGGASAISNLGMYGVREFSAIVNPPHATILAVGAAQRRPVEAEDGSVKFVTAMTLTLSCDHRVVDGALGAELLGQVKGLLENPVRMLV
jgi:pyruvate dehydrogenase E2 component (dihydrolipoamide acetyltransferase)